MVEIKPLTQLNLDDLHRLVRGYVADATYHVHKTESGEAFTLTLELVPLSRPYVKQFELDAETVAMYQAALPKGFSFGAYDGDQCAGIALAEPHYWNNSLWVWEFHVAATHQRQGIGRRLVAALAQQGRAARLRTVICETQNTNVPAIHFYRQMGFQIEGIDISYYSNNDYPDGEMAIFMKKRLDN
jgi:ribosomal protein S18 acetylase RimI-like enzyme